MIKIPLTINQINDLLKWRDDHKNLVRNLIVPFPECEIISENGMKIRSVKDNGSENVYAFTVSDTNAHEVRGRFKYNIISKSVEQISPKLPEEDTQSAITVWASVLAFVLNFHPEVIKKTSNSTEDTNGSREKEKSTQQKDHVVYLKNVYQYTDSINPQKRKYTPCETQFSVRGHYRHMKSGKIVYIKPYEKNTGKKKTNQKKILKIGDINNKS